MQLIEGQAEEDEVHRNATVREDDEREDLPHPSLIAVQSEEDKAQWNRSLDELEDNLPLQTAAPVHIPHQQQQHKSHFLLVSNPLFLSHF